MPPQRGLYEFTQLPDPFAVDNADSADSAALAFFEVCEDDILHVARAEGVQIQFPIDRQCDGFRPIARFLRCCVRVVDHGLVTLRPNLLPVKGRWGPFADRRFGR